jgi:hypothetical protein
MFFIQLQKRFVQLNWTLAGDFGKEASNDFLLSHSCSCSVSTDICDAFVLLSLP